jgi:tetrapyrrole methylase family protein/MazG family protein/ATP diphosphatase
MTAEKFINFLEIVKRLRDPDGCPWDRKQTPQTFKKYLLEESHELLEAINEENPQHIKEELGDLLFQIIFLCGLYAEQKLFSLDEVIDGISDKMIRRHPHVFGDKTFDSESEMRRNWQAIKSAEKREKGQNDNLVESIPKSLPALRYTQRVLDRLSRATVPALDPRQAVKKFENLTTRLQESVAEGVKGENDELFGDLFFLLAFLGQISGTDAEEALKKKVQATVTRFTRLEQRLTEKTGNGILSREEAVELLFGGPEQRNGAAKKV